MTEASEAAVEMTAVVSGSSFSYAVAVETAMAALSAAAVVDVAAAADAETIAAAASIPSHHAKWGLVPDSQTVRYPGPDSQQKQFCWYFFCIH